MACISSAPSRSPEASPATMAILTWSRPRTGCFARALREATVRVPATPTPAQTTPPASSNDPASRRRKKLDQRSQLRNRRTLLFELRPGLVQQQAGLVQGLVGAPDRGNALGGKS